MYIDFDKYPDRLVPTVVQDTSTKTVLMLGFMSEESLSQTRETGRVTFFSRSRNEIWIKGQTSGFYLDVDVILKDCDNDTILIKAKPAGPVCHTGSDTCFAEMNGSRNFLYDLEKIIEDRKLNPFSESYTAKLFSEGLNRIAQKVGEEAFELVIAAKDSDDEEFKEEAADLVFHMLVLFAEKQISLDEIVQLLKERHGDRISTHD